MARPCEDGVAHWHAANALPISNAREFSSVSIRICMRSRVLVCAVMCARRAYEREKKGEKGKREKRSERSEPKLQA